MSCRRDTGASAAATRAVELPLVCGAHVRAPHASVARRHPVGPSDTLRLRPFRTPLGEKAPPGSMLLAYARSYIGLYAGIACRKPSVS